MQTKIPVYAAEATNRGQTHLIVRDISIARARLAVRGGSLADVSPISEWRKGRITHVQELPGLRLIAREILPCIANSVLNRGRAGQGVANYPIPYAFKGQFGHTYHA